MTTEPTRLFFFSVSEHGCGTPDVSGETGRADVNKAQIKGPKGETHQRDDTIMFLHFLPEVLETCDQAVVERPQLLGRLLAMDTNPLRQQGDLQRNASVTERAPLSGGAKNGGRSHLQGDEVFQNLDALLVLWVLLDVGIGEERLRRRRRVRQNLNRASMIPNRKHGARPTFS